MPSSTSVRLSVAARSAAATTTSGPTVASSSRSGSGVPDRLPWASVALSRAMLRKRTWAGWYDGSMASAREAK